MTNGRNASVVVVSPASGLLGMLPPLKLPVPFWPECADVVAEVESRFAVRVVVLRLLLADPSLRSGGDVAYLVELVAGAFTVELLPVPERLRELAERRDSKRMPWAELGGPARSVAWARGVLAEGGRRSFEAVQQRSWNLSTLWRFEPGSRSELPVWLKHVPNFMKCESSVLRWLNHAVPGSAPLLLADDAEGRELLGHVTGEDLYDAPVSVRLRINERLHQIQSVATQAVDELLALGVPDLRGARRGADCRAKLLAWAPTHPGLPALLRQLDAQLERLEECALPATLVHSDNHPGNARGSQHGVSLLDWGEAFVGNPVTDLLGAIAGLSRAAATPLKQQWCDGWRRLAPGSKPEQALELAPFIAAMHGAATYAHFLTQIEQSEWPYHGRDVPHCLEAASELIPAAS